jgi:hypothetical protein
MVSPNIMSQFVAEYLPDILVEPEAVISVGSYAQLDSLALVHVQAQQFRMFMRGKFREDTNSVLVLHHDMPNSGIGGKFVQNSASCFRIGQMFQRLDVMEFVLGGRSV